MSCAGGCSLRGAARGAGAAGRAGGAVAASGAVATDGGRGGRRGRRRSRGGGGQQGSDAVVQGAAGETLPSAAPASSSPAAVSTGLVVFDTLQVLQIKPSHRDRDEGGDTRGDKVTDGWATESHSPAPRARARRARRRQQTRFRLLRGILVRLVELLQCPRDGSFARLGRRRRRFGQPTGHIMLGAHPVLVDHRRSLTAFLPMRRAAPRIPWGQRLETVVDPSTQLRAGHCQSRASFLIRTQLPSRLVQSPRHGRIRPRRARAPLPHGSCPRR